MTGFRQSWPWWRRALMGLSAVALVLSGYLSWHQLMGGTVIGCAGGSACEQVLNSRWSVVGRVLPVGGVAMGVYLAMMIAIISVGPGNAPPVRRLAWRAMLVLAGAIAGGAVWFIIVQKWMVGSFCPYCMATHIIGLLLAALVIRQAPRQFDNHPTETVPAKSVPQNISSTASQREIRPRAAIGFASIGVALAGILAACQVAFAPAAVYRGGEAQGNSSAIDPAAVPLIGSPKAAYVVSLLFDYKCPHCQRLHFLLDEAVHRYDGKLAFALCPAPLNRQCNPYIPRDVDEFADSCDLAKVGLVVWVAKREAFPAFDNWMFSLESGDRWHPRSFEAARAKAVELVGRAKFDASLADPWIDRYLQTSVRIYGDSGSNAIPKLVFGSRWVTPQPNDADEFVSILQDSLALPKP